MLGKQLSIWTMSWFGAAALFLVAALALAVLGVGGPGNWSGGAALAMVHLFALGWLGHMMGGALIQFVPVLAARPLVLPRLALPALLMSVGGTAMLAAGFLGLDGWGPGLVFLQLAPVVIGGAVGCLLVMLGRTLCRAGGGAPGWAVMTGLAALVAVWATGSGMALALAGAGIVAPLVPAAVPFHVLIAIGGWMSVAAFGVSYKLFAMFMLAPETETRLQRATLRVAGVALAAAVAGPVLMLAGAEVPVLFAAALALSAVCAGLYLADVRQIWRTRRRAAVEVNMRMTPLALAALAASVVLSVPALIVGDPWAEAAVWTALAGWLSTLTLAQMVKIVSFLTWIDVYGPVIGRRPVPMVHDLVDEAAARRGIVLWYAGTIAGTGALIIGSGMLFRVAAAVLLVSVLDILRELFAIRRLRHVSSTLRPERIPSLFLPLVRKPEYPT